MSENNKTSQQIYDEWYARLDLADKELVQNVDVTNDDDYPFEVTGRLSQAAKERGGFYKSEVGWTVMWRPFPPKEYYAALNEEQEAKKAREDRQLNEKIARHQVEKEHMNKWIETHLHGYECVVDFSKTEEREGEEPHFATGSFGTGVSFYPKRLLGYDIWTEYHGNASRYWVPSELADLLHRRKWEEQVQKEGEGKRAFYALTRFVSGLDCAGDDLYQWLFNTVGLEQLIATAQASAPITLGNFPNLDDALASKYYRVPVRVQLRSSDDVFVVGYGDANVRRGPAQTNEQWERDRRMHGWVPIGEENNPEYAFPTEADIQEGQKLSADYAQFFSDFA